MKKIKFIFGKLYESGVSRAKCEEDKSKIKYLNQGMIWGTIMFLPNVIFEAFIGFHPATVLNLIFIFSAFVCFCINRMGKHNFARNFAFVGLDLILLTASFTEGTRTGNYLVYLGLILMFPIFIKLKDNKNEIIFLFVITILCLLTSLIVCPFEGYFDGLSNADAAMMLKASFLVAFGLTTVLAYIIFLITRNRELDLIKAKEEAEESAKIKLQFISNMSHELRTPLNGIIGTTNLLQLEKYDQFQKEQYELLNYSSQHMLHLINDVLDFSKIESGKIELEKRNFNLQTFVKNIYNSFAPQFEQKQLYFKLLVHDSNLNYVICSDDIRLGQILNNLLSNALKFTHTGGVTLSINASFLSKSELQISFDVADTGIGIKQNSLDNIFESFVQGDLNTTRKYGGTGLGLTISKRLTEVFNATLHVESVQGKGSRFYFSPVFEFPENGCESIEDVDIPFKDLTGMNILIAEDNKINMLIARKFLLKWGVNVTEAKNGKVAIDLCKQQNFDLILLDLEMPEADGYTALKEIRKHLPHLPAIAFTAVTFEDIDNSLLSIGFNDFILKPFVPHELNGKLYKQKLLTEASSLLA